MMIPTNRNVSNLQLTLIFKITLLFHTHTFQKTPLNYLVIFVFDSLAALNFPCSRKYMKKKPFQEKAKWVKTIKLTKLNKKEKHRKYCYYKKTRQRAFYFSRNQFTTLFKKLQKSILLPNAIKMENGKNELRVEPSFQCKLIKFRRKQKETKQMSRNYERGGIVKMMCKRERSI